MTSIYQSKADRAKRRTKAMAMLDEGQTLLEVARQLHMNVLILDRWRREYRKQQAGSGVVAPAAYATGYRWRLRRSTWA